MNKVLLLIVAVLSLLLFTADLIAEDNFMWEIEGGSSKMYLLGSIHLMPEEAYPLNEKIEECFEAADILAVEADPAKLDQTKVQQLVMQHGVYTDGETLQANIDSVLYNRVAAVFGEFGLPMQQVNMYKPWFVSLNMAMLEFQKMKMSAELGIDLHFLNAAKAKEMEIIELESGMGQLELLTSFPEDSQDEYLEYSLNNYENVQEMINTMVTAWQTGDAELMNTAIKQNMLEFCKTMPAMQDFYNRMFPERDNKIVVKLDEMLKDSEKKTYFIVVGSGHLVGDDGLLKLLKDRGYKTTQL